MQFFIKSKKKNIIKNDKVFVLENIFGIAQDSI